MEQLVTRIERVLELMFSRVHQREASRRLKVSVSLLSETLSGSRRPSKTLVKALAKMPEVNERWLLHGIGEPLFCGGASLPLVSRLPKTATTRWEEVASKTESFRVSENKFSESRYWWEIKDSTMKSWGQWGQKNVRAAAGDFLLLETDPGQMEALVSQLQLAITAHPDIEAGKPCWGALTADMRFASFKEAEQKRVGNEERQRKPKRKISRRNLSDIDVKREAPQKKMSSKEKSKIQIPQISFPRKKETSTKITTEHLKALVIEMTSTSIFRFGDK